MTSLVAVKLGLEPYDPWRVHLAELSRGDVEDLLARFAGVTEAERAAMAGLQPKRASVILGGTIAVAALMESCGFDRLTVCLGSRSARPPRRTAGRARWAGIRT